MNLIQEQANFWITKNQDIRKCQKVKIVNSIIVIA